MYFHHYWLTFPDPDPFLGLVREPAGASGSRPPRHIEGAAEEDNSFATGCRREKPYRQRPPVPYEGWDESWCQAVARESAGLRRFCGYFRAMSGMRHFSRDEQPGASLLSQSAQEAFVNHSRHRHIRPAIRLLDKRLPMLNRLATFVPLAIAVFLTGCAGQVPQNLSVPQRVSLAQEPSREDLAALNGGYRLPAMAGSILMRGFGLLGTPYRYGGNSEATGFDCSGFIGYLFREEVGIKLPRSTREMISLDAPRVARNELAAGDLIFFNNRGRGRVSHVGVYIGDGQFLHSASRRSGGVRVDNLNDDYWSSSYLQAKRALVMASHDE